MTSSWKLCAYFLEYIVWYSDSTFSTYPKYQRSQAQNQQYHDTEERQKTHENGKTCLTITHDFTTVEILKMRTLYERFWDVLSTNVYNNWETVPHRLPLSRFMCCMENKIIKLLDHLKLAHLQSCNISTTCLWFPWVSYQHNGALIKWTLFFRRHHWKKIIVYILNPNITKVSSNRSNGHRFR